MPNLHDILKATILIRCVPVLLILLCCVATFLVDRIWEKHDGRLKKEKSNLPGTRWNRNDQAAFGFRQKSRRRRSHGIYLAAGIFTIICLFRIIPACGDLVQERYVVVSGEVQFGQLGDGDAVMVKTENHTIELDLPANWKDLGFPAENEYGEIWYSQQSKILLTFCENGEDVK